jgi:hypothetical protein
MHAALTGLALAPAIPRSGSPGERVVTSPGRGRRPTTPSTVARALARSRDRLLRVLYRGGAARTSTTRGQGAQRGVRARVGLRAAHTARLPARQTPGGGVPPAARMLAFPAPNRTTGGRVAQMHSAMPMRHLPPQLQRPPAYVLTVRPVAWP